jgi:hypothetical protein
LASARLSAASQHELLHVEPVEIGRQRAVGAARQERLVARPVAAADVNAGANAGNVLHDAIDE